MHLGANTPNPTTLTPVPVPGTDNRIMAIEHDGEVWVSPNHICMALHIDWKSQSTKLKAKPWATMVLKTMVGADGRNREMTLIDRRTLTMWLATIEPRRIKDGHARSILEAYQVEAADALDSYFHKGGAINPRADVTGYNADELIYTFQLPRNYSEALRELADTSEKLETATVENLALKGGDGIRIKDFIKTYFVAPNERAFFEWFYFRGYLIDGRIYDEDGKPARLKSGPKLRWDHMHPTYIGRRYFKLVPTGANKYGGKHARIIPERALDLVAILMNAEYLATQMTQQGREALDEHRAPGQLRIIHGSAAS